jgi:putative FmdB family regulatory protein
MPIYEYQCHDCTEEFEHISIAKSDVPDHCKLCGSTKINRVMSTGSFRFKGEGSHKNDYPSRRPTKDTKPTRYSS